MQRNHHRHGPGKLFVVGIGPGHPLDRTRRAEQAIRDSEIVVGYKSYLEKITDLTADREVVSSGMRHETERGERAIDLALEGRTVSLVSSGDPGIYGMAGLALEMLHARGTTAAVEVIPGVTAASAAAARLGAPLMLDFAVVSLSDLLVPWDAIERRLRGLAPLQLVVCLYNPKSKKRVQQIERAAEIFRVHRPAATPVGVCTALGTAEERTVLTDLGSFTQQEIDMKSLVIIGADNTRTLGSYLVTARGYRL